MKPLVSIIIPCFNTEKYISEAIASALNQTYPNIEVIVVDDGSTDRSLEIIQSFGDRLIYEQINHQGACAARNRGLQLSKGKYIQFLDADDLLLSNKIETQLPLLESNQADLVFCNGYLFGDNRPCRPVKSILNLPNPWGTDPFLYCLKYNFGTNGPLHKREFLEQIGGFREGLIAAQETDLNIRLAFHNIRILKIEDFLFKVRNHSDPQRITQTTKPAGYMLSVLLGIYENISVISSSKLTEERKDALASCIFQHSIYAYRNGNHSLAAKGFQLAKQLSKKYIYNERLIYKILEKLISPMILEGILSSMRSIKKKLTSLKQNKSITK